MMDIEISHSGAINFTELEFEMKWQEKESLNCNSFWEPPLQVKYDEVKYSFIDSISNVVIPYLSLKSIILQTL